jgi:hypothetical protein
MHIFLKKSYEIMDVMTNWPKCLTRPIMSLSGVDYPCLNQLKYTQSPEELAKLEKCMAIHMQGI